MLKGDFQIAAENSPTAFKAALDRNTCSKIATLEVRVSEIAWSNHGPRGLSHINAWN